MGYGIRMWPKPTALKCAMFCRLRVQIMNFPWGNVHCHVRYLWHLLCTCSNFSLHVWAFNPDVKRHIACHILWEKGEHFQCNERYSFFANVMQAARVKKNRSHRSHTLVHNAAMRSRVDKPTTCCANEQKHGISVWFIFYSVTQNYKHTHTHIHTHTHLVSHA